MQDREHGWMMLVLFEGRRHAQQYAKQLIGTKAFCSHRPHWDCQVRSLSNSIIQQ